MSLHKICQKLKPNVERFLSLIFNAKWLHVVQSLLGQPDILKDHHYVILRLKATKFSIN